MVKDLRPQLGRKAPFLLIVVGLIALFFASFYLFQLFQIIPDAIDSDSVLNLMLTLGMILLMFVLYTNYVITIFRLSSGSRKAWVGMTRLSFSYIAMVLLSTYGLGEILPMNVLAAGTVFMWVMIAVMVLVVLYMLTPNVTKFFTPGYADEVSVKEWAKFIVGVDPFKGSRMIVTDENLYV